MNTITPAFPGSHGDYADQAPGWGTYRGQHARQRPEARPGRVRKPNRRRGVLLEKAARAVSVAAVAYTVGAVLASLVTAGGVL